MRRVVLIKNASIIIIITDNWGAPPFFLLKHEAVSVSLASAQAIKALVSRLVFAPAVADKDSKRRPHGVDVSLL